MRQDLRTPKDLYKEYLTLYKAAPKLSDFEDFDDTWSALLQKRGLPVKYVDILQFRDLIPMDTNLLGEGGFYDKNQSFYLIPNEIDKRIVSFVLRGLQHSYADYTGLSTYKPLFGIFSFLDFKLGSPIILTEGVKDAIILQKSYPYTLAVLGVGLTRNNKAILKRMTNKIILAYDNDIVGLRRIKEDTLSLRKEGFNVLSFHAKGKDFGESLDVLFKKDIQELIEAFPIFTLKG